jgi:hypothetical protein
MELTLGKLVRKRKTKKVDLGSGSVTIIELPFGLILKLQRLQTLLAKAGARLIQKTPLAKESFQKVSVPVTEDPKGPTSTTDTASHEEPSEQLIDKSISVKQEAIESIAEAVLSEDLIGDIILHSVLDFKGVTPEELFGDAGLSVSEASRLLFAIIDFNFEDFKVLGNSLSPIISLMKGAMNQD